MNSVQNDSDQMVQTIQRVYGLTRYTAVITEVIKPHLYKARRTQIGPPRDFTVYGTEFEKVYNKGEFVNIVLDGEIGYIMPPDIGTGSRFRILQNITETQKAFDFLQFHAPTRIRQWLDLSEPLDPADLGLAYQFQAMVMEKGGFYHVTVQDVVNANILGPGQDALAFWASMQQTVIAFYSTFIPAEDYSNRLIKTYAELGIQPTFRRIFPFEITSLNDLDCQGFIASEGMVARFTVDSTTPPAERHLGGLRYVRRNNNWERLYQHQELTLIHTTGTIHAGDYWGVHILEDIVSNSAGMTMRKWGNFTFGNDLTTNVRRVHATWSKLGVETNFNALISSIIDRGFVSGNTENTGQLFDPVFSVQSGISSEELNLDGTNSHYPKDSGIIDRSLTGLVVYSVSLSNRHGGGTIKVMNGSVSYRAPHSQTFSPPVGPPVVDLNTADIRNVPTVTVGGLDGSLEVFRTPHFLPDGEFPIGFGIDVTSEPFIRTTATGQSTFLGYSVEVAASVQQARPYIHMEPFMYDQKGVGFEINCYAALMPLPDVPLVKGDLDYPEYPIGRNVGRMIGNGSGDLVLPTMLGVTKPPEINLESPGTAGGGAQVVVFGTISLHYNY